jgi:peroxin-5
MGMYGMNMGSPMFQQGQIPMNGKGKSREADFEAAFALIADSHTTQSETARIVEVQDGETGLEEALNQTKLTEGKDSTDFKA